MLVSCPKCGFSQPQDKYCANCGIDMESFHPQRPSASALFLKSPLFHILLVLGIIGLVIAYVNKKRIEDATQRIEFLRGGPVIAQKKTEISSSINEPTLPDPNQAQVEKDVSQTAVPSDPPAQAGMFAKTNEQLRTEPEAKKELTPVKKNLKIKVSYAEVDHTTMESLRQDSRTTGQYTEFGDFKAGALPSIKKPTLERGVRVLDRNEIILDPKNLSHSWFNGVSQPKSATAGTSQNPAYPQPNPQNPTSSTNTKDLELGITSFISVEATDNQQVRGEIEIARSFKESIEPSDLPIKRSYPSTSFELTPGMSWMISINLPAITQDDLEHNYTEGIMRIFQSSQYKSRITEFTIFFEFDSTSENSNIGKTVNNEN